LEISWPEVGASERPGSARVGARMAKAYFYVSAAIYILLAGWCTFQHEQTAAASGYLSLNASGHSEYLVVYGGLQLGIGIFYAYLATRPEYFSVGIIFSVLMYVPIVIYRAISVVSHWPVSSITLGTAGLEWFLLIWALLLLRK
jgi:hypothetical protein